MSFTSNITPPLRNSNRCTTHPHQHHYLPQQPLPSSPTMDVNHLNNHLCYTPPPPQSQYRSTPLTTPLSTNTSILPIPLFTTSFPSTAVTTSFVGSLFTILYHHHQHSCHYPHSSSHASFPMQLHASSTPNLPVLYHFITVAIASGSHN